MGLECFAALTIITSGYALGFLWVLNTRSKKTGELPQPPLRLLARLQCVPSAKQTQPMINQAQG